MNRHFFPSAALIGLAATLLGGGGCEPLPGSSSGTSASSSGGTPTTGTTTSARQAIDATALCARLIGECAQPLVQAECVRSFSQLRVTASCNAGLSSATCADLTNNSAAVYTSCFPPCAGTLAACNGDGTITVCTSGGATNVLECSATCVAQGFTQYTGTCGRTFDGGQSADRDQCWCS